MEYLVMNGELYHHGIKGQKWGVRRWQNADGTFNAAGKERYFGDGGSVKGAARRALAKVYSINEKYYSKRGNKMMASANKQAKNYQLKKAQEADAAKLAKKEQRNSPEEKAKRIEKTKKALKVGAIAAGAALAAYGGYKLYSNKQNAKKLVEFEKQEARRIAGEKALKAMYDKQMMDAFKDPNVLSYVIRDDSINYYNAWSKK